MGKGKEVRSSIRLVCAARKKGYPGWPHIDFDHEGLDYQFRQIADVYRTSGIGDPSRIVTTGGSTRNAFWMQNKADVTGSVIEVPDLFEATPLGAALMAGIGVGTFRDAQEAAAAVRGEVKMYEPDPEKHKIYTDLYENVYKRLQFDLKEVNAALSKRFR